MRQMLWKKSCVTGAEAPSWLVSWFLTSRNCEIGIFVLAATFCSNWFQEIDQWVDLLNSVFCFHLQSTISVLHRGPHFPFIDVNPRVCILIVILDFPRHLVLRFWDLVLNRLQNPCLSLGDPSLSIEPVWICSVLVYVLMTALHFCEYSVCVCVHTYDVHICVRQKGSSETKGVTNIIYLCGPGHPLYLGLSFGISKARATKQGEKILKNNKLLLIE